jgi:hypothetical protein
MDQLTTGHTAVKDQCREKNTAPILQGGADGVAVISAISKNEFPKLVAGNLRGPFLIYRGPLFTFLL